MIIGQSHGYHEILLSDTAHAPLHTKTTLRGLPEHRFLFFTQPGSQASCYRYQDYGGGKI
jgi:hypothetical protein